MAEIIEVSEMLLVSAQISSMSEQNFYLHILALCFYSQVFTVLLTPHICVFNIYKMQLDRKFGNV